MAESAGAGIFLLHQLKQFHCGWSEVSDKFRLSLNIMTLISVGFVEEISGAAGDDIDHGAGDPYDQKVKEPKQGKEENSINRSSMQL